MRTWLPGPKPWGGTKKRALLRRICVPAARGVEVLITIFCWIVAVAEVVIGRLFEEEIVAWFCLKAGSEEQARDSPPIPLDSIGGS